MRSQSRVFNAATGEDVMPQDIKSYQQYANKRICFDTEEATDYKKFNISGRKVLLFVRLIFIYVFFEAVTNRKFHCNILLIYL